MKKQQIKTRLRNILSIAPQLHDIIVSSASVEEKKDDVHTWLSDISKLEHTPILLRYLLVIFNIFKPQNCLYL